LAYAVEDDPGRGPVRDAHAVTNHNDDVFRLGEPATPRCPRRRLRSCPRRWSSCRLAAAWRTRSGGARPA
jgi:hypothetical protein